MVSPACPTVSGAARPARVEVAEVFRRFGPSYLHRATLTPKQGQVLRSVIACRTAALGGHIDTCDACGESWHSYNSCRDRHCPTCQGALATKWIAERQARFLDTHHFHVVSTVPEALRPIALANPRLVYDLLFDAVSETLLQLARDRWDAVPAITAVLHTWTRDMSYHPHLHCIVSGGGLSDDGERWISSRPGFLFPVRVMSALIRGKFMARFVEAYEAGRLHFSGSSAAYADPVAFAALRRALYGAQWVVYAKPPFDNGESLVRYLSRYTHRVAISSSRMVSIDDDAVVFRTRGSATCRLPPDEFIRRFLLHVLPVGFRKVRHYGLLAPSNVGTKLPFAQDLARAAGRRRAPPPAAPMAAGAPLPSRRGPGSLCPSCEQGHLVRWTIPPARPP